MLQVREGLLGCDNCRVHCVNSHWVKDFHVAHSNAIVIEIADCICSWMERLKAACPPNPHKTQPVGPATLDDLRDEFGIDWQVVDVIIVPPGRLHRGDVRID